MLLTEPAGTPTAVSIDVHSAAPRSASRCYERVAQLVTMPDASLVGRESRVDAQVGPGDRIAQKSELLIGADGQDQGSVPGLERVVRSDARMAVAHGRGNDVSENVTRRLVGQGTDQTREEIDLNSTTCPGKLRSSRNT